MKTVVCHLSETSIWMIKEKNARLDHDEEASEVGTVA